MGHRTPHSTRYIDEEADHDKLYEVTLNTVQDRYFFIPSKLLNLMIIGVLAFSQRKTGLRLCWVTFLTTHALWPAAHNACYVQCRIMRSHRLDRRPNGWLGGAYSA